VKRRAWNIFCALSLLIFAASVALWVRSYSVVDVIDYTRQVGPGQFVEYGVVSSTGSLRVLRHQWGYSEPRPQRTGWYFGEIPDPAELRTLVFTNGSVKSSDHWTSVRGVTVPLWLFLPAAIPPFLWWQKRRKLGGRGFVVEAVATNSNSAQSSQSLP